MSVNDLRVQLNVEDIPKKWYNIAADLPEPLPPPLNPGTNEPAKAEELYPIFPKSIVAQEMSTDRYIDIPPEVREALILLNRPSPLQRAKRLEQYLKTPAKIYFKREDLSPAGSHKPNTAVAQAYYNMKEGVEHLTTETGAGQWGSALSLACNFFDLECRVFMVRVSYDQKPFRRHVMETYGAKVYPSPSTETEFGRKLLEMNPNNSGSLGIAISEAIETAVNSHNCKYSLGSVANHVMLHQSVIGEEALKQMDLAGEYPDVVIGCVGGGSNFSGIAYPFLRENLKGGQRTRLLAVEPDAVPSFTKGVYAFDFGDTAKMAPVLKMHTLGHSFIPPSIHAGGLRYHGMAPSLSALFDAGLIEATAVPQKATFEAALMFARTEGILPAPESAHAIRAAIDEALDAKTRQEKRVILFNLSGHGHFDMASYQKYLTGDLDDYALPSEAIQAAMADLPQVVL